jgi:hypothetical protein
MIFEVPIEFFMNPRTSNIPELQNGRLPAKVYFSKKNFKTLNPINKPRTVIIFSLLAFIILFLGYNSNFWRVTDRDYFESAGEYEGAVISRIIQSEKEGIFSYGGFPGWTNPPDSLKKIGSGRELQYHMYYNEISPISYRPYTSQIGVQGMLFSLLNNISPFTKKTTIGLFKAITAAIMSIIIISFIVWAWCEFGYLSAVFVLLLMVLSHWPTAFARSLWFMTGIFYFPFVASLWLFKMRSSGSKISVNKIMMIIFFAVFIKLILNGFEFITTSLLMIFVAPFYYWIKDRNTISDVSRDIARLVIPIVCALIFSVSILSIQHYTLSGSPTAGVEHIMNSIDKRTSGELDHDEENEIISQSLEAGVGEVLGIYMRRGVFGKQLTEKLGLKRLFNGMSYGMLISIFSLISVLSFIMSFTIRKRIGEEKTRKLKALSFTYLFAFLPPLSWYIIFKRHSYIHKQLDSLLWHMPLLLFGAVLSGYLILRIIRDFRGFSSQTSRT